MRTIRTKIFKFSELSPEIQKKVLDKNSYLNIEMDPHWYLNLYDFFKEDPNSKSFNITQIYFSGFASQGDGAMFEGNVIDFSPFLTNLPTDITNLIQSGELSLSCSIKHNNGRYYHENSGHFYFEADPDTDFSESIEKNIKATYKTLCKKLFRLLETEYDYLTSDAAIIETIEANEIEYFEDGTPYNNQ